MGKVLWSISVPLSKTSLQFVLTLIITVAGSLLVIKLSDVKRLRWLKYVYM